ncbi:PstS family phosphate ABC transporter substrate-binding protein [Burkholderia perseverans]|uniref:PstS family phosphate ABC transporter substrate-binding protein n=1 Tax=Burkholderia perseverans TaxID=2615214 RepID=UPI001FEE4A40|nr:substrate-binding domain-containing protein [Burkholderia perseverans]
MKLHPHKIASALLFGISALAAASAAVAAGPVIQGGGSSGVAPLLTQEIGNFNPSIGAFTYFPVGSGAGENAFLNNQPALFGPSVSGTVDFANSDAGLLGSQITNYTLAATNGALIQIPYVVMPVAIAVANTGSVTGLATPQTTPGQTHSIALNDDDLCGIFSGKLTNWNQVINPETGAVYPNNAPLTVLYRTDGSGETELLTRHLSQICSTTNTATGVVFQDSLMLADSFGSTMPANFLGVAGDSAVRSALTSATGATIRYLSPAYTNTFLAPTSSITTSASAGQLQVVSLQNSHDGQYYAPTYANATTAIGPIVPPQTKADASNPLNWVKDSGNPVVGYPVSGTSQIILSQCYRDPNVTQAMVVFLATHYTSASNAPLIHGNGFDTIRPNFVTAILDDFLTDTSTYDLNIGNSGKCTGAVVGR